MTISSEEILEIAVKAADDKRAEDIMAMDVRNISILADYFVVMHGNSEKQVEAIVNEIVDQEEMAKVEVKRIEGRDSAKWMLIDLGDVVVHVFHYSERSFYNLEKLWSDAPLVDISKMVD
ncbi:ribosome silencing factor [Carnobacterium divergens]|uniref:Ribosomal silencing factor RsfS n=1 Tax=Carnobacterium divergens TaxID=2748 RepID=A0A2R8A1Z3_CARDV|nr:ribosome silencing factor [Carnobacterium divergens]MDO0874131.1 ribosome silencing factor [Carnobacterium divergens]MDT1958051.1 ribosome silencing factor [Carnobacterium divergens]MDT1974054.1 ribosome silencing factor [Carnobacterium divergens]MDT2011280.1 ribosome silencing factor [Carnobacterium divergens]SPC40826.1 ribosomal silencing factor [Carnobacterium divergens]